MSIIQTCCCCCGQGCSVLCHATLCCDVLCCRLLLEVTNSLEEGKESGSWDSKMAEEQSQESGIQLLPCSVFRVPCWPDSVPERPFHLIQKTTGQMILNLEVFLRRWGRLKTKIRNSLQLRKYEDLKISSCTTYIKGFCLRRFFYRFFKSSNLQIFVDLPSFCLCKEVLPWPSFWMSSDVTHSLTT